MVGVCERLDGDGGVFDGQHVKSWLGVEERSEDVWLLLMRGREVLVGDDDG